MRRLLRWVRTCFPMPAPAGRYEPRHVAVILPEPVREIFVPAPRRAPDGFELGSTQVYDPDEFEDWTGEWTAEELERLHEDLDVAGQTFEPEAELEPEPLTATVVGLDDWIRERVYQWDFATWEAEQADWMAQARDEAATVREWLAHGQLADAWWTRQLTA